MSRRLVALRIARREALRAKARSLLVLVMIGFPVAGVVAADTLIRTQDVSSVESLPRELGAADARVSFSGVGGALTQTPDAGGFATTADGTPVPATAAAVRAALGPDTRLARITEGSVRFRTAKGVATATARQLDLGSPLARGLFDLRRGRLPTDRRQVLVSEQLASRGFGIGASLPLTDRPAVTVVGVARSASSRAAFVAGLPGSLGIRDGRGYGTFLAARPGGVSWSAVRRANRDGMVVLSRAVVEDPPPDSAVDPAALRAAQGGNAGMLPVLALVVVMALLEVVLLAGPAFAVGARRRQRTLALMAATGGEPRDLRRTVLADGVVLGTAGALAGAALGLGVARAATPLLQRASDQRFGPFDPAALDVAGIAAFGLLSAVLAAAAPAWLAARQDVVAVLAGRRADHEPSLRSPALGGGLVAAGIAGALVGARGNGNEIALACSALLSVLGMVLLVPVVVVGLGRLARRFPLPLRYALRDAARHRSRTTPAVAAVAATVVGVTILGIAASSDARQSERTYPQAGPVGSGFVSGERDWAAAARAVRANLPAATVTAVRGNPGAGDLKLTYSGLERTPADTGVAALGTLDVVASGGVGRLGLELGATDERRADATLATGGAVVFGRGKPGVRRTTIRVATSVRPEAVVRRVTVPAVFVVSRRATRPADAVIAPAVARRLRVDVRTVGLLVTGTAISDSTQQDVNEALAAVRPGLFFSVERGFEDDERTIILLVLAGIGAALMLGGTLTATFLALSDARGDLATLAAVGAPPGLRRLVAAAYAGAVGLVGALLGIAVGLVPGIAAGHVLSFSSTVGTDAAGDRLPVHFLSIPWPLLGGVAIVLPLLTAAIVGVSTRARLPLTMRTS